MTVFLVVGPAILAVLFGLYVVTARARRSTVDWVPAARWERTDEVVEDPFTNRRIRVWVDPKDGSRHLVPERSGRRRYQR